MSSSMFSNNSYKEFMKNHKARDGELVTHTRIGDVEKHNVYPGKYHIPSEDLPEFYELYKDHVFVKNNKEYLTEKQMEKDPVLCVDFDFRYENTVQKRQHHILHYDHMVCLPYFETLMEFCDFPENCDEIKVFIMEKPNVNILPEYTKDGIHLIMGCRVDRTVQKEIRKLVLDRIKNEFTLPLINSWDDVIDKAITNGSNNWQLLGSRKPGHEAYEVIRISSFTKEKKFKSYELDEVDCFPLVSVQNENFPILKLKNTLPAKKRSADDMDYQESSSSSATKVMRIEDPQIMEDYKKLEYFFTNGFDSADFSHPDMCNIGYAIHSMFGIDHGLSLFLSVAEKYSTELDWEDEYTKKFEKHLKPKHDWNMGFFINLFQTQNKALYQQLNKEYNEKKKQDTLTQREENIMNSGNIHVCDDNEAAERMYALLHDKIVYTRGQLFYKNENIWIHSKATIDPLLLDLILTSRMYKYDKNKKKEIPYSQNVSNAKNIREALYCKIMRNPNDRFYEKFHLTTKGKIAFRDGVLDFQNRKFYLWNEIDFEYYSTQQIERDFKEYFENPNHEIMELVKSKIYDLAFGEKVDTALQFFSRAISGHNEDKNWATYIGNRDCGKGVIYDSLVNAFESYVKSFELSMIQYQRQTESNETSRKLYWLLDLEFVRLGINQEIPSVKQGMKTCGKTLKKMTGGNDDMIARRNYDRVDTHFKIDTTFLIMGNNEILVDTDDAFEHRIEFHSVIQFKTQEEINQMIENGEPEIITQAYKIKDEDIKIKCTSDEWRNAMVYLLYEYYRKTPVSTERKAEEVVENENQSLRQKIIEQFNITCNQSDEILCVSVEDILDADKKKIKNELESMRVKKIKCKRGVNRDKNVYVGLKQKVKCLLEYDGNGMDETKS